GNGVGPAIITAPDGGITKTYYTPLDGLAWKSEAPNHDIVERLWYQNRPPNLGCTTIPCGNPYIKTEFHSIQTSSGLKPSSIKDYIYDKNNNLTSVSEYDCLAASC